MRKIFILRFLCFARALPYRSNSAPCAFAAFAAMPPCHFPANIDYPLRSSDRPVSPHQTSSMDRLRKGRNAQRSFPWRICESHNKDCRRQRRSPDSRYHPLCLRGIPKTPENPVLTARIFRSRYASYFPAVVWPKALCFSFGSNFHNITRNTHKTRCSSSSYPFVVHVTVPFSMSGPYALIFPLF